MGSRKAVGGRYTKVARTATRREAAHRCRDRSSAAASPGRRGWNACDRGPQHHEGPPTRPEGGDPVSSQRSSAVPHITAELSAFVRPPVPPGAYDHEPVPVLVPSTGPRDPRTNEPSVDTVPATLTDGGRPLAALICPHQRRSPCVPRVSQPVAALFEIPPTCRLPPHYNPTADRPNITTRRRSSRCSSGPPTDHPPASASPTSSSGPLPPTYPCSVKTQPSLHAVQSRVPRRPPPTRLHPCAVAEWLTSL
jgi:hypothetical protein